MNVPVGDERGTGRQRTFGRAWFAVAVACVVGCQAQLGTAVSGEGQVVLALVVPGGATILEISWTVTSSTGQILASGTTDTSRAGTTASVAVSLAAGTGDVVTMTATTGGGDVCSGSSTPFDVAAARTSAVNLTLKCQS